MPADKEQHLEILDPGVLPEPGQPSVARIADGGTRQATRIYLVPGYLGENWALPHGPHRVDPNDSTDLGKWANYARDFANRVDADVFLVNWPSAPTLRRMLEFWPRVKALLDQADAFTGELEPHAISLLLSHPLLLASASLAYFGAHWQTARREADHAGVELAHLCRQNSGRTIVIGHSLGGRVALRVREFYEGTNNVPQPVVFAPAVSPREINWLNFAKNREPAECFFSKHDLMLALLYGTAQLLHGPALGLYGPPKLWADLLRGINVSRLDDNRPRRHVHYMFDWIELLRRHSGILKPAAP